MNGDEGGVQDFTDDDDDGFGDDRPNDLLTNTSVVI